MREKSLGKKRTGSSDITDGIKSPPKLGTEKKPKQQKSTDVSVRAPSPMHTCASILYTLGITTGDQNCKADLQGLGGACFVFQGWGLNPVPHTC